MNKNFKKYLTQYENYEWEEIKKKYDRICKHCGYTNRIINKKNKVICKHCGNYVFLDPKEEFKYRIKVIRSE